MTDFNKPEPGKLYSLTGGIGTKSIAAGNTWAESKIKDEIKTISIISFDENSVPTKTEVSFAELNKNKSAKDFTTEKLSDALETVFFSDGSKLDFNKKEIN